MISIDRKEIKCSEDGGTFRIKLKKGDSTDVLSTPVIKFGEDTGDNWIKIVPVESSEDDTIEYDIVIEESENKEPSFLRSATIEFVENESEDTEISTEYPILTVSQSTTYTPIGNINRILPGGQRGADYQYRIKKGNTVIYEGITVALSPNEYPSYIDVNRILENFLIPIDYPILEEEDWEDLNSYGSFDFYQVNGNTETLKTTINVVDDWTENRSRLYTGVMFLNDPINGHISNYSDIPICVFCNSSSSALSLRIYNKNGGYSTKTLSTPPHICSSYNVDVENATSKFEFRQGSIILATYDCSYCGNGYLYYKNRYGGWDTFLIEGNVYKYDNYKREQHTNKNIYVRDWGKTTDSVETTTTYECSTGWLSDEQAEKLVYHLLSSPCVFFRETSDTSVRKDLISVNITNSQGEYKKFKNGRKLVRFNITFEESITKINKR